MMQQDEVAARAGLSVTTVQRLASLGIVVPSAQDGPDAPRYSPEDLVRLIRARHVGSLAAPSMLDLRKILAVLEALDDPTRKSVRGALLGILERLMRAPKTWPKNSSTAWMSPSDFVAEANREVSRQIPWFRHA